MNPDAQMAYFRFFVHMEGLADAIEYFKRHGDNLSVSVPDEVGGQMKTIRDFMNEVVPMLEADAALFSSSAAGTRTSASLNKGRAKLTFSRVGAVASSKTVDRMFDRKIRLSRKA